MFVVCLLCCVCRCVCVIVCLSVSVNAVWYVAEVCVCFLCAVLFVFVGVCLVGCLCLFVAVCV